jgi:hypothetical protein
MAVSAKTLLKANPTDETLKALAAGRHVRITATGGIAYEGNLRLAGQPVPTPRVRGASWRYSLEPGLYLFNVNIAGVAGATVAFTLAGATATYPTSLKLPGTAGKAVGFNTEIDIKVG